MIKISKNEKLDVEVCRDFYDFSVAGADFAGTIKREHPNISIENHEHYISEYYRIHEEEMNVSVEKLSKLVSEKEGALFEALSKIFGVDLSGNEIGGYISIFDCNPRYIESKSFQVFYKRPEIEQFAVVAHEVSHFAFFKMCDTVLKNETAGLDKNSGTLWELSEMINVLALNLPEMVALTGKEERLFYADLAPKYAQLAGIWKQSKGDAIEATREYLRLAK